MKIKVIGIIAILLVSVMTLGCVESPSDPKSIESPQTKTIALITASPAQMLPTINDMPDGFMKGSGIANDTYASQDFINTGFAKQMLSYKISKFSSIDKAKDEYISIINTYSNYKLTDVHLGDESVGFELADSIATVVFRKANTVIEVRIAGQFTANLDDTISYAKMVRV